MILKSILAISLVSITQSLTGESPTSPKGELSHSLDSLSLTIDNEKKHCQLQIKTKPSDETKTIPSLLETPCYWIVSSESKALLQYSYEAVDADNTLLIAGTPLDWSADKKSYQKLPADSYCTQYLQGVVISNNQVYAVDEKMVAAHCETGLAIDEKIFYAIAHNPKRYQEKAISEVTPASSVDKAKTAEALVPAVPKKTEKTEEKSFLESVTDSLKGLFSGETEKAK